VASTEEVEKIERFLDPQMWQAVTDAIEAMPKDAERGATSTSGRVSLRQRYTCWPPGRRTGKPPHEQLPRGAGLWWWHVVGKGGKKAKVPVADDMLQALIRYRKYLGLTAVPRRDDTTPLLVSVKDGSPSPPGASTRSSRRSSRPADLLPADAEHKKEKLRAASAHWGRHTASPPSSTAASTNALCRRTPGIPMPHHPALHPRRRRALARRGQKQRLPWTDKNKKSD
jgi:hypothetical protein